jgi:hypothetical protein
MSPHYPTLSTSHLYDNSGRDDLRLKTAEIVGVFKQIILGVVGELAVVEERVVTVNVVGVDKTKFNQKLLNLIGLPATAELLIEAASEIVEVELTLIVDIIEVGVSKAVAFKFDQEFLDVAVGEAGAELAVETVEIEFGEKLFNVVLREGVAAEQAVKAVAVEVVVLQERAEILSLCFPIKLLDEIDVKRAEKLTVEQRWRERQQRPRLLRW